MTVIGMLALYVGVPALLFGSISLLVLVFARTAPSTGSPVLRPGHELSSNGAPGSETVRDVGTSGEAPPDGDDGPVP